MTATYADIVRRVAAEFGKTPDDDEIGEILWGHTGFPSFWTGDPAECCEAQVRALYASGNGYPITPPETGASGSSSEASK